MGEGMNLTCTLCTLPDLKGGGLQRQKKKKKDDRCHREVSLKP